MLEDAAPGLLRQEQELFQLTAALRSLPASSSNLQPFVMNYKVELVFSISSWEQAMSYYSLEYSS